MRTTLKVDPDAMEILRAQAAPREVVLGTAASDLIHRGTKIQLRTRKVNRVPVFNLPADFPRITDEDVRRLLEEE